MKKQADFGVVELSRILAGQSHAPVVYFARMGENVKIGTTTNLRARMSSFYVPMSDVLAVVPGGEDAEKAYHERFKSSQVADESRQELFRLDAGLRFFLGLSRRQRPRRGLPPGFLPQHEVGNALDLDEELRSLEDDVDVPWDAERAADLADRLAYLDSIGCGQGPGFAAKLAYFWHATHEEYLATLRERGEAALRNRSRWWWLRKPLREAWAAEAGCQERTRERAERSAAIRDLLVDALRSYGLDVPRSAESITAGK